MPKSPRITFTDTDGRAFLSGETVPLRVGLYDENDVLTAPSTLTFTVRIGSSKTIYTLPNAAIQEIATGDYQLNHPTTRFKADQLVEIVAKATVTTKTIKEIYVTELTGVFA